MKIGGHRMREHIRLLAPIFGLVAAIWILRIILAAADSPAQLVRIVSLTTTTTLCMIPAVLFLKAHGFASYTSILVASLLINLWAQFLIISSIVFAMITRTHNIYVAREYYRGGDPVSLHHIYGHVTYDLGLGTLVGTAVGCLLMWLLRDLAPKDKPAAPGSRRS